MSEAAKTTSGSSSRAHLPILAICFSHYSLRRFMYVAVVIGIGATGLRNPLASEQREFGSVRLIPQCRPQPYLWERLRFFPGFTIAALSSERTENRRGKRGPNSRTLSLQSIERSAPFPIRMFCGRETGPSLHLNRGPLAPYKGG